MADQWYIARGKKKGPYSLAQMKQLAAAVQLLPQDMVLQEGTSKWLAASQVQTLWPLPDRRATLVAPELAEWHYTHSGQRCGSATWTQLLELASSGKLLPTDMVWTMGMDTWAASSFLHGFVFSSHCHEQIHLSAEQAAQRDDPTLACPACHGSFSSCHACQAAQKQGEHYIAALQCYLRAEEHHIAALKCSLANNREAEQRAVEEYKELWQDWKEAFEHLKASFPYPDDADFGEAGIGLQQRLNQLFETAKEGCAAAQAKVHKSG